MPVYAEEAAGEEPAKTADIPESANYVESEAIVCYKAAKAESDAEKKVKQETESVLEE